MFAQTTAILTSRLPSLEELEAALADLHVAKRVPPAPDAGASWLTGRGGVVVPSGSGARGRVVVTLFDQRWPDSMGSPSESPELLAGTKLCGAIIGGPQLPSSILECETAPEKTVRLYAVYPIHSDEMDLKLARGAEELFEKMYRQRVGMVIDPRRRSCLARKLWLV